MKQIVRLVLVLLILGVVVFVGFKFGPRVVYMLPPFQSWVVGQINGQSGGNFEFDSITGSIERASLEGVFLDMRESENNLFQGKFPALDVSFAFAPLLKLSLDLTTVSAQGGDITLKLKGNKVENIRLPINAEAFLMKQGNLTIQNFQGYDLVLKQVDLTVNVVGEGELEGSFNAGLGTAGQVEIKSLSGSFSMNKGGLRVTKITATLPGESSLALEGSLNLDSQDQAVNDSRFSVTTDDVKGLLNGLGYSESFGGNAQVSFNAYGRFRPDVKDITGKGNGELSSISAAVNLPSYPGFENSGILNDLKLIENMKGRVIFTLKKDMIYVKPLDLSNDKLSVLGSVEVGYDQSLTGNQTLKAKPELAAGIPSVAQGAFKVNENKETIIPFYFAGTTQKPAVTIDSVVAKTFLNPVNAVGGVGKAATGILGGLFGGGKKDEKKSESAKPAPAR
ncbi:MAG: hypothetical protein AAF558_09535 [Verrucomicrobiota bacterium]